VSRLTVFLSPLLASVLFCGAGHSQDEIFCETNLSGSQMVPPSGSSGLGRCTLAFRPTDGILISLWYWNLPDSVTCVTVHSGVAGENGPVMIPLFDGPFESGEDRTLPWDDSLYVSPPFTQGGLYVIFHTDRFPEGELRGQLDCRGSPVNETTWGRIRDLYHRTGGSWSLPRAATANSSTR
jgi:hypothetical protein